MAEVYIADVTALEGADAEKYGNFITARRLSMIKALKSKSARAMSLGAGLLLAFAVKRAFPDAVLPPAISLGRCGKPYLSELPLFFSLSHSGRYALCAVSKNELGADIEQVRSDAAPLVKIADRFFHPDELAALPAPDDGDYAARFCELWVKKESYIKATGEGLSRPLDSFSATGEGGFAAEWRVSLLPPFDSAYRAAVCVGKNSFLPAAVRFVDLSSAFGT